MIENKKLKWGHMVSHFFVFFLFLVVADAEAKSSLSHSSPDSVSHLFQKSGIHSSPDSLKRVAESGYGEFIKVEKAGKYGLMDAQNLLVAQVKYEAIERLRGDYMKFTLHGLKGLLDKNGDEIVESYGYDDIIVRRDYFVCEVGRKALITDHKFNTILGPKYGHISPCGEQHFLVYKGFHRNAVLDSSGKVVIGFGWGPILDLDNTVWDFEGNWTVNFKLSPILDWRSGVIKVRRRNKVAFYDYSMNKIIDYKYRDISFYNDSQLVVQKGRKRAITNSRGVPIHDNWYRYILPRSTERLLVMNGGKKALASIDGKLITDFSYDYIGNHRGMFMVSDKKHYGVLDASGCEIIPLRYDRLDWRPHGQYFYCQNKKWGLMDSLGNELTEPKFDRIYDDTRQKDVLCFLVKNDGLNGWISPNGELLTPIKYTEVGGFKGHLSMVGVGTGKKIKRGAINGKGVEIVPLIYNRLMWKDDHLYAYVNDEEHVFDSLGARVK